MLVPLALLGVLAHAPAAPAVPIAAAAPAVHCQVPCGIYGDHLRLELLEEHAATIERAMQEIESLGADAKPNWNQLVRWVQTKEEHAQKIQDQIAEYWLAQRIKAPTSEPGTADFESASVAYIADLMFSHRIIQGAMKCKQSTNVANVATLRSLIQSFKENHFTEDDVAHMEQHHAEEEEAPAISPQAAAMIGTTKASLRVLAAATNEFALNNGSLPDDLEVLILKDATGAAYIAADEFPRDPWGGEYVYVKADEGFDFKIVSYGSDGKPGGVGDAADLAAGPLAD